MRDENVTNDRERHPGKHELSCDAVTAINHVRGVVGDDDLRCGGTRLARPGTASRSKQNEPGSITLNFDGLRTPGWRAYHGGSSDRTRQKSATADGRQVAPILSAGWHSGIPVD